MNVVIVESAAKAKTINKYLGSGYKVIASYGHVRDLPAKDGSVEPDHDFNMHWEVDTKSQKIMREIAEAVKKADKLILATDPDREGEAISWHILQILNQKKALGKDTEVERVAFNAITKQSILAALKEPRKIDEPLVDAYLARRALDYLVGFTLSPVLWRKLPGSRSAGRVQSVALRLVCDREAEIEAFKTEEYWTIEALLSTAKNEDVRSRLVAIDGTALKKLDIKDEATATAIRKALLGQDFRIASVEKKATKRNPFPPFTTSTLQMDASRKLGFSAKQTMQIAQRLYEGVDIGGETVGLITYMRTDGVQIVPEAVSQIRDVISAEYGKNYTPFAREYKTKAKNAQEAHEAIRPTDPRRKPDQVRKHLEKDQAALYDLIWKRTIASQMAAADIEQTTAEIDVKGSDGKAYGLRANGSVLMFDGFLKVYEEGRDDRVRTIEKGKDDTADEDDDSRRLPPLAVGDRLKDKEISADQHFTQPPPRFSEATLVKRMEELGIGRPSTYASTMAVLVDRDYVRIEKKRLIPEDKGRLVIAFLESFFKRYVEYDFTADLEEKLDLISNDELEYKQVLRDFWRDFMAAVGEIKDLRVGDVLEALNEMLGPHVFPDKGDGSDPRLCPKCGTGRLSLKISGKYGAFIGCGNYPECNYTRQLTQSSDGDAAALDGKILGYNDDGLAVTMKTGRFGPYIQLGEAEGDEKPKRSSIPRGIDAATLDFERAMQLLSLPRDVGEHPDEGGMITAGLGRFGPFIVHEKDGAKTYVNLESLEDVFTVGLNRAVTLIAEKRAGGGKSRFQRNAPKVVKDLGQHPSEGGAVQVLEGRYGPYVTHNKVNATVPKAKNPAELTMDEAVALINERTANGGGKKGKPARGAKAKAAKDDKPAKAPKADKAAAPKAAKKPAATKTAAAKAEKAPAKKAPATSAGAKKLARAKA
ncbi:type I DNA topoisomerase [Hyphomicrobium sp. MC1]|uniref:type I DNA topoisomerase n=1 Tax=Hyphomicrobium sp. (strain MC1) TaxID=717785 RepID=UPI000213D582|nr:type I DNA topoisomerase [Hyphomicrobium sp. MC1]CCB64357.1 DNA topoisomerase I [Hyphomicrobium sp. MC1]